MQVGETSLKLVSGNKQKGFLLESPLSLKFMKKIMNF